MRKAHRGKQSCFRGVISWSRFVNIEVGVNRVVLVEKVQGQLISLVREQLEKFEKGEISLETGHFIKEKLLYL